MRLIKPEWLFEAPMERVICHWTAGGNKVSDIDKEHYHLLVDGEGKIHRGHYDIDDNLDTGNGLYAAHTWGLNTRSIGVAVCGMAGASSQPFNPGKYGFNQLQWERMAQAVAELCLFYKLAVSRRTVLQHGEVGEVYGIDQWGKWDVTALPWEPKLSADKVCDNFRFMVKSYLKDMTTVKSSPVKIDISKSGSRVKILKDGKEENNLHLALQIKNNRITAMKLDGNSLNVGNVSAIELKLEIKS